MQRALLSAYSLALILICGCEPGAHLTHTVEERSGRFVISRASSKFIFKSLGGFHGEYRIFGFNEDPMGVNNKDEYVRSFGLPLMITHLFVAAPRSEVAKEYLEKQCEKDSANSAFRIPVIAFDKAVASKAREIESARATRKCAKISGKKLDFFEWLIDGKPVSQEHKARMTKSGQGFNFLKPVLLTDIEPVDC